MTTQDKIQEVGTEYLLFCKSLSKRNGRTRVAQKDESLAAIKLKEIERLSIKWGTDLKKTIKIFLQR